MEVRGSVEVVMPGLAVPVVLGWGLRVEEVGRWVWGVGQEVVEGVVGMKGLRVSAPLWRARGMLTDNTSKI